MPRDAGTAAYSQFSQEGLMKRLALLLALALCSATAFAAINLNTATKEELVALPGIGPTKAQAILDYRSSHGQFKSIEEVKDVKGIGAKRFEKLKGELTVVGASVKPSASARPAEQSAPQRLAKGTVTPAAKRDETMGAKP
jgi:competence protein ComEA